MKFMAGVLLSFLLAGGGWNVWAQEPPVHRSSSRESSAACEQEWQAMAQRHREQAQAMLKESAGLRSLLNMLRSDAGIVKDSTVRDALQVDADMWESLLGTLQSEAAGLQALAQQAESRGQTLCGGKVPSRE